MKEIQTLYETYYSLLMKYALSLTHDYHQAEDLTQETFYKALKSLHRFDGKGSVSVWLCQILKHTFYDQCRKAQKQRPAPGERTSASPEEELLAAERWTQIFAALEKLSENYRNVFALRYFHELSFREIGACFHKSESWARVTYYRAKEQLKKHLQEEFDDEM